MNNRDTETCCVIAAWSLPSRNCCQVLLGQNPVVLTHLERFVLARQNLWFRPMLSEGFWHTWCVGRAVQLFSKTVPASGRVSILIPQTPRQVFFTFQNHLFSEGSGWLVQSTAIA